LNKGIDQAIFRQDAAHSRQAFAQAAIWSSDFIFSHSVAQASQAFAQAAQAADASVQDLAIICVDRLQNSWQLIAIAAQAA